MAYLHCIRYAFTDSLLLYVGFSIAGVPVIFVWSWAILVYSWTRTTVNFVYILELDTTKALATYLGASFDRSPDCSHVLTSRYCTNSFYIILDLVWCPLYISHDDQFRNTFQ